MTNKKISENANKLQETNYFINEVFSRTTLDFKKSLRVNCWQINQVTSKSQMDLLNKICKQSSKTEKVNVRNILGTKFQLKLTILNFWTKIT